MTESADPQQDEKPETNPQQRIEQRLQTNAVNNVNQECEAKKKSDNLQPDEGTAGPVSFRRLSLIDKFFQFAGFIDRFSAIWFSLVRHGDTPSGM